jgi:hypothetical protein
MKRKASFILWLVLATIVFSLGSVAQGLKAIKLPPQTLSNLLWAAFKINRPGGLRTAPSAMKWQEVSICVATPESYALAS